MDNCEEQSCANVQSAICLHCNRRLCATHVLSHETILLEETDKLLEQINELSENLNALIQDIQTTGRKAMNAVAIWREKQLLKIEDRYNKSILEIQSKQDQYNDIVKQLSQQLAKDAREPLERMQTQKSANNDLVQHIRQTIIDIKQKRTQLTQRSAGPSQQSSSLDTQNIRLNTPQQIPSNDQHQNQRNSSGYYGEQQYPFANPPSIMQMPPPLNSFTNVPISQMNSSVNTGFPSQFHPQYTVNNNGVSHGPYLPQRAATSATPTYPNWTVRPLLPIPQFTSPQQQSTMSTESQINMSHIRTNASEKLTNLFLNIGGSNEPHLDNFIIYNLNRAIDVNNMMILILSYLRAWHPIKSPNTFNKQVLFYHIHTIKRYINGRDHELTAIHAITVFIASCHLDEYRSGQLMNILLELFYDNKCISKTTILDWYENGPTYGYTNFHRTRLWAHPFIDRLKTHYS